MTDTINLPHKLQFQNGKTSHYKFSKNLINWIYNCKNYFKLQVIILILYLPLLDEEIHF